MIRPDDTIHAVVVRCADPHPTDGEYVRRFYMSQLGPTSTALIQLLAGEGSRPWRAHDMAVRLGVGRKAANHANNPLGRSLDRLVNFRLVERVGDDRLYVRSHLPRLDAHQLARATDELRRDHDAWLAAWEATAGATL